MRKLNQTVSYEKFVTRHRLKTIFICIILIFVILLLIWNIIGLKNFLEWRTENYVEDVSNQLASDVSHHMQAIEMSLKQTANTIPKLSDLIDIKFFLEEQTQETTFDKLLILDQNEKVISKNFGNIIWKDLPSVQESFGGKTEITIIEGQNLVFSTSIPAGEQSEKVLLGICRKEKIQALIQPTSFKGKGLACIINNKGEVMISPTSLKPFLQLDNIFKMGINQQTENSIVRMRQNMLKEISGTFQFTAIDNSRLVLAYHALGVNDWILLTLVPADLISGKTEIYILRMFLIVTGIIVIFILWIFSLRTFFADNKKQLKMIAFIDPLTGGMNHDAFQVDYAKKAKVMAPNTYTIVLLNIKDFKLVNEKFGVQAGNETLKYIYSSLEHHIDPEKESVARGDGDQFFLCLRENNADRVQNRLDGMIQEIQSAVQSAAASYCLPIIQGAYIIDDPRLDITTIEDRVRAASKIESSSKCSFYSSEIMEKLSKDQELNILFDNSIRNCDFHLFLQPKIRLKDETVAGAEALCRWIHPQKGILSPGEFIPLFEKNDRICRLDQYMFEKTCQYLKDRMDHHKTIFPISVNLSRAHFRHKNFLQPFIRLKEIYQIPDGMIELEMTETIFSDERQRKMIKNFISEIHKNGFRCSLDDFGVGYSSLALLKEFEVDVIKLDRLFFADISTKRAQNVVSCFIDLANKLGMETVAEGIETSKQLEYLCRINCGMVQGYIYSKPLSVKNFDLWMTSFERQKIK
ncbi:MAG: EAL domain-containing protein [Clostridiales bacterium]|nr:EAL domain-containing protein [Clostridiales bacterium]